jgi:hypothetical protein
MSELLASSSTPYAAYEPSESRSYRLRWTWPRSVAAPFARRAMSAVGTYGCPSRKHEAQKGIKLPIKACTQKKAGQAESQLALQPHSFIL